MVNACSQNRSIRTSMKQFVSFRCKSKKPGLKENRIENQMIFRVTPCSHDPFSPKERLANPLKVRWCLGALGFFAIDLWQSVSVHERYEALSNICITGRRRRRRGRERERGVLSVTFFIDLLQPAAIF